jgi:hypothetical protein
MQRPIFRTYLVHFVQNTITMNNTNFDPNISLLQRTSFDPQTDVQNLILLYNILLTHPFMSTSRHNNNSNNSQSPSLVLNRRYNDPVVLSILSNIMQDLPRVGTLQDALRRINGKQEK